MTVRHRSGIVAPYPDPGVALGRKKVLERLTSIVPASLVAGWCFVGADAWRRGHANDWLLSGLVLAAVALYCVVAAAAGLLAWLAWAVQGVLTDRLARRWPRSRRWSGPALYALAAALAVRSTAVWTFHGPRARAYAHSGPALFVALVAVAAAVVAALSDYSQRALERGRWLLPALLGLTACGVAAALVYSDLHLFVALYSPLHTLLEISAWLLLLVAGALAFDHVATRRRAARVLRALTVAALAWVIVWFSARSARAAVLGRLAQVWLEPIYVGRMMRRLDVAQGMVAHPGAWRDDSIAAQLRQRFNIKSTARDPVWDEPLSEPPDVHQTLMALRGPRRDYNIIVYYVDTLRADVTRDARSMPNTVAFARQSLDFRRTYSSGSDTLRALPGITGGTYDIDYPKPNDLIQVAREAGMRTVLAIPQSAHEFLQKLRPTFHFDETYPVPDYPADRTDVWGYGADRSTARPLVDESVGWMRAHKKERFLLWVFNFDQHNWRELDTNYVHAVASKLKVPDSGDLNWRYRVVAAGIDSQFKRLLQGVAKLGLADKTIIVFIADHGESVGRNGFWVHSVFLWEGLVRVPLMIRIPGRKPASIRGMASLVDLAPTLVRYIKDDPDMQGYQGEDLLMHLLPKRPPRRLPLLLSAVSQDQLVRVGMLEPDQPWKLVLSLETATPELYDLRAGDPDVQSLADEQEPTALRMLRTLVRSPVFPRAGSPAAAP